MKIHLKNPNFYLMLLGDAILFDEAGVEAKYHLAPSHLADLKALAGDVSDNIPGVLGVGEKTAARLTFYLLHVPEPEINKLGNTVLNLKKELFTCSICKNISDREVCELCSDGSRDQNTICVVEQPLDVFSFEGTGTYHGLYYVLHGVIDPLHNIGPEELYIDDLLSRTADEIILALNPTMEGEATSMYLSKQIREVCSMFHISCFKITRLAMGLPSGGDLEYADDLTLSQALSGRREFTF